MAQIDSRPPSAVVPALKGAAPEKPRPIANLDEIYLAGVPASASAKGVSSIDCLNDEVSKYRRKALDGQLRPHLGEVLRRLAEKLRTFMGDNLFEDLTKLRLPAFQRLRRSALPCGIPSTGTSGTAELMLDGTNRILMPSGVGEATVTQLSQYEVDTRLIAMDDVTFERLRPRLHGVALRILGSAAEADEVLQEARLRWPIAATKERDKAETWLLTMITRLCLNRLRERNREGEGTGESPLREPLATDAPATHEQMRERADDITVAYLTVLERLPVEARTAFLLRTMFDVDYGQIARTIGKTEAECRGLVQRAKAQFRDERPGYGPSRNLHFRLLRRFAQALAGGDFAALRMMLSDDAALTGDGSGKVPSFTQPIQGGQSIAQLLLAAALRYGNTLSIELAVIDGRWGLLFLIDGAIESAQSYALDGEPIVRIYVQRTPDNFVHLSRTLTDG
jgi:RNA polymerase sigma factor (sigma-70 family)